MGNTQRVWILQAIVLILNLLNADKQKTAAKRHGIERNCRSKPIYILQECLNFKIEVKKCICKMELKGCFTLEKHFCFFGGGFFVVLFCFHRKQEAVNLFQIDMYQGRLDRLYLSTKVTAGLPRTWSLAQIFSGTLKKSSPTVSRAVWRSLYPHFQEKRECGRSFVILWVLYVCYHLGECRNIG